MVRGVNHTQRLSKPPFYTPASFHDELIRVLSHLSPAERATLVVENGKESKDSNFSQLSAMRLVADVLSTFGICTKRSYVVDGIGIKEAILYLCPEAAVVHEIESYFSFGRRVDS